MTRSDNGTVSLVPDGRVEDIISSRAQFEIMQAALHEEQQQQQVVRFPATRAQTGSSLCEGSPEVALTPTTWTGNECPEQSFLQPAKTTTKQTQSSWTADEDKRF